ncbi:MAG: DEAD/DEAH box helicase [Anaerolineales bacterium]
MKISVENNIIIISDAKPVIRKYQAAQLSYYGYKYIESQYQKISSDVETDVSTILDFFEDEKIDLEKDSYVQKIITNVNKRKTVQKELFIIAKQIKHGEINAKSAKEFTNFLRTLPRKLKSHQIKAAFHLYHLRNGANFSVPGSGKTSVILSVYEKLRVEGKCNIIYVVGPPSCFQPWQNEFKETLGRIPSSIVLSGGSKKYRKREYYGSKDTNFELYLTTFQTLFNDQDDVIRFLNQNETNVFLVVDEAHYVKRIGSAWANSLLKIAKHAQYRCVLTGTPMPQGYTDIFNLFDFLWIKESPLTEQDKIQIKQWEAKKEDRKVKKLLNEKIGPLFYRVRKQDLGLKPATFHDPIIVKMKPYELRIHNFITAKIHELSTKDYLENEDVLLNLWKGRIIRLRQSVSYPKLLLKAIDDYTENLLLDNSELSNIIRNYDKLETMGKIDELNRLVLELRRRGDKVLIWSNFIGTLHMIKDNFSRLNLRSELIYGKTPRNDDKKELNEEMTREMIRDVFIDPASGLDILIANPAACAKSISLHKTCFHAIYFDLSYNCAQYLQSLDRIHRVGGSESNIANYYFLQYETSVDQDIKLNLELKAQKMYSIIEQDYKIYNLDMFEEDVDDDIAAYRRLFLYPKQNKSIEMLNQ